MNKKVITLGLILLSFISQAAEGRRHPPSPVNTGTFWSMQRNMPPLPFSPFPDLPAYEFEKGQYLYDDRAVDYEALRAQAQAMETAEPNAGQALMQLGGSGPALTISRNGQGQIEVQIVNAPAGNVYDLYQTDRLEGNSLTAAHWQKVGSGSDGDIFTFSSQASSSVFYLLGDQDTDQDLDGLADAYEVLVTKTSTSSANCPKSVYEAVVDSQSQGPNQHLTGRFKLNGGSLANEVAGRQPLVASGGGFENDVFAIGNGAYSFSLQSDKLTLTETEPTTGDAIGGGTGVAVTEGSFTLLFKALPENATGKRYLLSQGTSSSDAIAVYFDGTSAGGDLKLGVGTVEQVILKHYDPADGVENDVAFGAWYYLAVTCHEFSDPDPDGQVRWYLGRVGSLTLTTNFLPFTLQGTKKFGNNGMITLGNKEGSTGSAYRQGTSKKGYIDQVTFWERELKEAEVAAQFNALPPAWPSSALDLTRWNLLLPVNTANQVINTGTALEINTGWLNPGFTYIDPGTCTKKYFYRDANTMVFEAPYNGARNDTGPNAGPRSELRGTNPDGSLDNWLLSGTHTLEATCAVNAAGPGNAAKVIIGQIHEISPTSIAAFTINYNFPSLKQVSAVFYPNPDGTGGTAPLSYWHQT